MPFLNVEFIFIIKFIFKCLIDASVRHISVNTNKVIFSAMASRL